jgi:hypothetical protein
MSSPELKWYSVKRQERLNLKTWTKKIKSYSCFTNHLIGFDDDFAVFIEK